MCCKDYACISIAIDETSMQIAALKILATALGKDSKSLCYLYEEHNVSLI